MRGMKSAVFGFAFAGFMSGLTIAVGTALAGEPGNDGIVIENPLAAASIGMARAGAGYMIVANHGDAADRLLDVEADFPRVMIHMTEMNDGVASMKHVMGGIEVPPGGSVHLAPGGYHVMFMGLSGDGLIEGTTIPATLVFESAGRIAIEFDVVSRDDLKARMAEAMEDKNDGS